MLLSGKLMIMTEKELNTTVSNIKEALKYPELFQNISGSERLLSGAAGSYLFVKGISKVFSHPVIGLSVAVAGAGLFYRALTGYCPVKDLAEQKAASVSEGITVTETFIVDELA